MIQGNQTSSKMRWIKDLVKGLWSGELGASLVEFALLLPFLLSLAIGIAEMSNVFFIRNVLNEVVRDAARRFAVGAMDKSETEKLVLQKVAESINSTGKVIITESKDEGKKDESGDKGINNDVTVALTVSLQDLLLFENLSGGLITLGDSTPKLTFRATMLKY
jgi:Flp pilus assembly protein TadG